MIGALDTWTDQAACKGRIELFFPANRTDNERAKAGRAIAICNTCAVIDQCRTYAVQSVERYGIWGGLTPEQLSAQRRHSGTHHLND